MRGIYKQRPPKPKYDVTWDPKLVLKYLESLPNTDLKTISSRLVTMMALATGQRLQTLSLIKCSNINQTETGIRIFIPDPIKTSGPNRAQPCLDFPYFTKNPRLCVAGAIKEYLTATEGLRDPQSDLFFITSTKPYRPASKQTLSRWVKETMEKAGVDSSYFKAHSTRHASTSAALRKGLPFETIRKCAGWSEGSLVFSKFYNRPLIHDTHLMEAVFDT